VSPQIPAVHNHDSCDSDANIAIFQDIMRQAIEKRTAHTNINLVEKAVQAENEFII